MDGKKFNMFLPFDKIKGRGSGVLTVRFVPCSMIVSAVSHKDKYFYY